ncbi:tripartite tricarboxylate transporter TctB family protein [candidate division KSB1 bacterium]|nr:tripartite tricarboxylate transporter TctB family protein [candidate division KSB1 bacterium]
MNEIPSLPGADKVTTFLSRKQKAWGKLGSFIVLAVIAVGLYAALPFITNFLTLAIGAVGKTIVLGILIALAAILWFVFTSKKFRAILWYLRAKFYRWFTSLMIKSNPLDTIYAYVEEYLGEKLKTIQGAADNVYGIRNEIKNNIQNYKSQINERIKQADALKSRFYKDDQWNDEDKRYQFQKISSEAGMLQANLNKSEKRFERAEKYCQIMKKMQQAFEFYRDKTKFFADTLSADYREAQAMAKATQATSSALGGDARVDIYEQSVKYVQNQISLFTGQVDRFMEVAPQFMAESEIHDLVSEDAMMKTLDQWDKATEQLMEQAENIGKAGQALSAGDTNQAVAIVISGEQKQLVPVQAGTAGNNKKYSW